MFICSSLLALCRVRIFPYRSTTPLYLHMHTKGECSLGLHMLPYTECTTISQSGQQMLSHSYLVAVLTIAILYDKLVIYLYNKFITLRNLYAHAFLKMILVEFLVQRTERNHVPFYTEHLDFLIK